MVAVAIKIYWTCSPMPPRHRGPGFGQAEGHNGGRWGRPPWCVGVRGIAKSQARLSNRTTKNTGGVPAIREGSLVAKGVSDKAPLVLFSGYLTLICGL